MEDLVDQYAAINLEEEDSGGISYETEESFEEGIDTQKFCSRIFEASRDELVKPYGQWMRALPRRQSYLTGSKWLRSGSTSQGMMTEDGGKWKSQGGEEVVGGKSGVSNDIPRTKEGGTVSDGVIHGIQEDTFQMGGKLVKDMNLNDADMVDLDGEYSYVDPKRRRPNEDNNTNPSNTKDGLPKNVHSAGLDGGVCPDK
ncbi:hypothetical protein POM88_052679 [Heracleum sosnowskyi]|uniref:Uncharacterized protein n=1 Tax=Heracleum sosnowskyi TaxID=360622 RepID=A0AAD8GRQ2_9APIA|nr:hypothetical protein POM88_052679 [Heracleum sosnowskyi]